MIAVTLGIRAEGGGSVQILRSAIDRGAAALRPPQLRTLVQTHGYAIADQAAVSGVSFFTMLIVGRCAHSSGLGTFTLGMSFLLIVVAALKPLVTWPYMIRRHESSDAPAELAGGVLLQTALLAAVVIAAATVAAGGLIAVTARQEIVDMMLALAAAAPLALLREFGRQFSFAQLKVGRSLALDAAVAVLQIAGLVALAGAGRLSAAPAYAVIGAACGLSGFVWLYLMRGHFAMPAGSAWSAIRDNWDIGKWLFANQLLSSVQTYAAYWILAGTVGTAGVGIYSACMSIVLLSNPFVLGFANVFSATAPAVKAQGGTTRLRGYAAGGSLFIAAGMLIFCLVMFGFGHDILRLFYPNPEYRGHYEIVALLSLAVLLSTVGLPANTALITMARARLAFALGVWVAVSTAIVVWWLSRQWGLAGAAWGAVAGAALKSASCWLALLTASAGTLPKRLAARAMQNPDRAAVLAVLANVCPEPAQGDRTVERLSGGDQAEVFLADGGGGAAKGSVVVKLYRPAAARITAVREECRALQCLYRLARGTTPQGWRVSSPEPLHVCERPLAIVMSAVPGTTLTELIENAEICSGGSLEEMADVVVCAMRKLWDRGWQFGDFYLDNVLCRPETREIGFVDPYIPPACRLRQEQLPRHWYPASHDLARLLFETGVAVRRDLRRHRASARKKIFVARVLRRFAQLSGAWQQKNALFAEIEACAHAYARGMEISPSLRGARHLLLRPMTAWRMKRIIAMATSEEVHCPVAVRRGAQRA